MDTSETPTPVGSVGSIKDKIVNAKSYHDAISRIIPDHHHCHPVGELKPKLKLRDNCQPKLRTFRIDPEFETEGTQDFLDENSTESGNTANQLPKAHGKKGELHVSNFKSKAVYCEVKLAEMLGKGGPRVRPITPGKYEAAPDAYRASVCCLLLGEICEMDTPYSGVLRTILETVEQAIYSNYVTPHEGGTFDQVPYFELVSNLETQHQQQVEEQERWKTMLQERQALADRVEGHIEELNEQILKEKAQKADLQRDLLVSQRTLRKSTKEMKELQKKLEMSRNEVFSAREAQSKYDYEVERYLNLEARDKDLMYELQHCQANLNVARQEAADGVPKEEYRQAQNLIHELQSKLQKAEKFIRKAGDLTPRPEWARIRGGMMHTLPTAMQAAQICEANTNLTKLNAKLQTEAAAAEVALIEAKQHIPAPAKEKQGSKKTKK